MPLIKILIIKIGAIGDVVMTLPLLRALRSQHPDARIDWLSGSLVAQLIQSTQLIDHLYTLDEHALFHGSKVLQVLRAWRQIGVYDEIYLCHTDPRYRFLIPPWCRGKCHAFGPQEPRPGHYHAEEYLRLARFEPPALFPPLTLPPVALPPGPLIAFAPGGAANPGAIVALKRWPIAHYRALIEQLQGHATLLVTGSPSDSWVREHLPIGSYVDLIGKLSLVELVSVLSQVKCLITHDSGPLHLGKLVSCPTIALFGPTPASSFVGPRESIRVLTSKLPCRPCYDGKRFANCTDNQCLQTIAPKEVFNTLKALNILSLN